MDGKKAQYGTEWRKKLYADYTKRKRMKKKELAERSKNLS